MHIPSAQIPWLDLCRGSTPNINGGWEQLLSLDTCRGSAAQEAQEADGERFSCVAPVFKTRVTIFAFLKK